MSDKIILTPEQLALANNYAEAVREFNYCNAMIWTDGKKGFGVQRRAALNKMKRINKSFEAQWNMEIYETTSGNIVVRPIKN